MSDKSNNGLKSKTKGKGGTKRGVKRKGGRSLSPSLRQTKHRETWTDTEGRMRGMISSSGESYHTNVDLMGSGKGKMV